MARYVDCFLIPVPKKSLALYKKIAKFSAKSWIKAGALDYYEVLGDDVPKGKNTSFPRSLKLKSGEVIVLCIATYKSRAHRDKVMAKIHQDEALMKHWEAMPVDGMRMIFGGFEGLVG